MSRDPARWDRVHTEADRRDPFARAFDDAPAPLPATTRTALAAILGCAVIGLLAVASLIQGLL